MSFIIGLFIFWNLNKNTFIILDDEERELFIEDNTEEISNEVYKTIISIDFGSSYSGFAIGYAENSIESKIENIQPTTIVIKRDNLEGYKYGNEAENFMNEPRTDEYIYILIG